MTFTVQSNKSHQGRSAHYVTAHRRLGECYWTEYNDMIVRTITDPSMSVMNTTSQKQYPFLLSYVRAHDAQELMRPLCFDDVATGNHYLFDTT